MIITVLDYGLGKLQIIKIIKEHLDMDLPEIKDLFSSCPFQLNVDDAIKAIKLKDALVRNGCKVSCTSEPDDINYGELSTRIFNYWQRNVMAKLVLNYQNDMLMVLHCCSVIKSAQKSCDD